MQSRVPQVLDYLTKGYSCCQAMLATYGDIHGLDRETALKLGSGMGGGVGHTGGVCGLVNGACLVLGLKHGHTDELYGANLKVTKLKEVQICREFCDELTAKFGSIACIDIIKRDIRTLEATVKAFEENALQICGEYAQFAAELLENKYNILTK